MIKTLPLISSDYESFEYPEETYEALTNQGQTAVYTHEVWNELVNKLSGAMDEAGLVWSADYGGVNETKMSYFDIFTAKRFNAVTYNIEKLINNKWKWDVVPDVTGFLGRARVNGYTEVGNNADVVYGWYLIELARVVNLFIDILKNEADFAELIYEESIETSLNDGIRGGDAERLEYAESIETSLDGGLRAGDSLPFDSESISSSSESAEMVANDGAVIEADNVSKTIESTDMISADGGVMESALRSFTEQIAKLNVCVAGLMKSTYNKQETTLDGEILSGDAGSFGNSDIASSLADSEMNTGDAQNTDADGIQGSVVDAEMILISPLYAESDRVSMTNTSLEMISISPYLAIGQAISESNVSSEIHQKESAGIEVDGVSSTGLSGGFIGGIAERIKASLISRFNVFCKLVFESDLIVEWIDPVLTGTNLYITHAYLSYQEENALIVDVPIFFEPERTGNNLYIQTGFVMEGNLVDTEYYIEPVQDDSELYIRQSFFEKE